MISEISVPLFFQFKSRNFFKQLLDDVIRPHPLRQAVEIEQQPVAQGGRGDGGHVLEGEVEPSVDQRRNFSPQRQGLGAAGRSPIADEAPDEIGRFGPVRMRGDDKPGDVVVNVRGHRDFPHQGPHRQDVGAGRGGRGQGGGVVIVSHDERIRDIADRVLWLEDGRFGEFLRMARDPVCGMAVERDRAFAVVRGGDRYWFCAIGCREEFLGGLGRNPAATAAATS